MNTEATRPRSALVAALAISCLASACTNSGLDVWAKEQQEAEEEQGDEGDPTILSLDECPTQCQIQSELYRFLNCTVDCTVDLDPDFQANATVIAIPVLVNAGFTWEGGGTCDAVVTCEDASICQILAIAALDETESPDAADTIFTNCQVETFCSNAGDACLIEEAESRDECEDDPSRTYEECQDLYQEGIRFCVCLYGECLIGGTGDACESSSDSQPPPMPMMTAPNRFNVSRRFIEYQVARADQLSVEIATIPIRDKTKGGWQGVQLRSIKTGDALHQLGLRNFDLAISANGMAIADPHRPFTSWLMLRNADEVRLVIRRQGQLKTLIYTLTN